jgi:protein gp37
MSQATAIGWTDVTWNPTFGCSIKSTECANCYAETIALKFGLSKLPWLPANATENVILKPHKLGEPFSNAKHWRGLGDAARRAGKADGKLVFVNSMSDLFHEQVPDEFIARVFAVMALAHRHTFQVLTKRPERMRDLLKSWQFCKLTMQAIFDIARARRIANAFIVAEMIEEGFDKLDNVWLGVSLGKREFVSRADVLRETPAAARFISAEPLLGPLMFDARDWRPDPTPDARFPMWEDGKQRPQLSLDGISWIITGGESGADHRPMDLGWCRDIRDACQREGVSYFHKQHGGARPGGPREIDGVTWDEFPQLEVAS